MGTWAFPTAFFLLCLTSESLQGGLPPLSPGLGKGLGSPNGYRSGYGPLGGLGAGFGNGNGLGTQPGIRAGVRAQKPASRSVSPGFGNGNGLAAGAFPGAVTQPGFGGGVQPQKPEYGNGLGMGAFPGLGAQPGVGGGGKPQKPAFGNGNRMGVGAQPGLGAGVSPQKPGFRNGNGLGGGAFPEAGAQPGFGGGMKPQKPGEPRPCLSPLPNLSSTPFIQPPNCPPGFGNGNGLGAQPGLATQNGYGAGFGVGTKPQKPGFGNGNGLGAQPGPVVPMGYRPVYRNGLGAGTFPGEGAQPGLGRGLSPPKPGYLPGPRLQLPAGYGNGNGLRAQSGSQLPNGYGVGTELGFGGGLKPQKVGFVYGNGLGAGVFLQPEFPGANGLRNGYGEEAPAYPKAAVPGPEGNGQAGALRSSSWPSVQPWGLAPKPGYGAGATYGQLRPELGPGPFGSPDAKRGSSGLGNGYGGP
eukprot:XP_022275895.1 glycine-rich cell wall structural protein-like isoform X16 [Canis lupus familiaris]